jgi:outer membrane protein assembly factor BamB
LVIEEALMKRISLIILILVLIITSTPCDNGVAEESDSWSCQGGNNARTQYIEDDFNFSIDDLGVYWSRNTDEGFYAGPVANHDSVFVVDRSGIAYRFDSFSSTMIWRKDIGVRVVSTPCISKTKMFVCSFSEEGSVYCLDIGTGGIVWVKDLDGPISASPFIHKDKLYTATENALIACLDTHDGRILWSRIADDIVTTSPCITEVGVVFADNMKQLYCLDFDDGTVVWSKRFLCNIASAPSYFEDHLYLLFQDGSIASMDSNDPEKIYWFINIDKGFSSSACVSKSHIVTISTRGNVYLIRRRDGVIIWSTKLDVDSINNSPFIKGTTVFVADNKGHLFILDLAKEGKVFWECNIESNCRTSPAVVGERIFLTSENGDITCLSVKPSPGSEPVPKPDPPLEGDDIIMHGKNIGLIWKRCGFEPVTTHNGNVFVVYEDSEYTDSSGLIANVFLEYVDKETGKNLWNHERHIGVDYEDTYGYQYIAHNGKIYMTTIGDEMWIPFHTVTRYDINTKKRDWMSKNQIKGFGDLECPLSLRLVNGILYVGNCSGQVFALDANDGWIKWDRVIDESTSEYSSFLGNYSRNYLYWVNAKLSCTDILNGTIQWTFDSLAPEVSGNPVLWDNSLLVASRGYNIDIINCLNRFDGEQKWSYDTKGYVDTLRRHESVLVYEEYQTDSEFCDIVGLDLIKQEEIWRIDNSKYQIRKGYKHKELIDGVYYAAGSKGKKSFVCAIDPLTGTELWSFPTEVPVKKMLIDDDDFYNDSNGKVFYLFGGNCTFCYGLKPKKVSDTIIDESHDPNPEPLPPTDPYPPEQAPVKEITEDSDPCGWYMDRGYMSISFVDCLLDTDEYELAWVAENDYIPTSPIVANNKVYYGSSSERDDKSILTTLQLDNGKIIKQAEVSNKPTGSLCMNNSTIFSGTQDGVFRAISRINGSQTWEFGYHYHPSFISSPFIFDGYVYFVSHHVATNLTIDRLHCINPQTSEIIWRMDGVYPYTDPICSDGMLVTLDSNKCIICLSAYTGEILWQSSQSIKFGQPIIHNGRVYARASGYRLYCYRALTGELKWLHKMERSTLTPEDFLYTLENKLYVLTDRQTGTLLGYGHWGFIMAEQGIAGQR